MRAWWGFGDFYPALRRLRLGFGMTLHDPKLSRGIALHRRQISAMRAAFLVEAHHGVALRSEVLPKMVEGDLVASVSAALSGAGFRVRALQRCS